MNTANSEDLKVKREEAGSYVCEYRGFKFTVYQRSEREIYTVVYTRSHAVLSRVNRDWAFSLGKGEAFRGYGSKKQAIKAAICRIENKLK
jgi:hypothetical protein